MHKWAVWVVGAALIGLAACGRADEAEAPPAPETTLGELEVGFDRPSGDMRNVHDVADAEACQALCAADEACLAFTWVQAGVQAETAVCWLKDQVPGPIEAEWATSGVMPGRQAPVAE